jgi:hypothetical protein
MLQGLVTRAARTAHGCCGLRERGGTRGGGGGGARRHQTDRGLARCCFLTCSVSNRNSVPSDLVKKSPRLSLRVSWRPPPIYPYTAYITLTSGGVSICITLLPLASASSMSRTEGHVPLPTAPTPPQGAAPASTVHTPSAVRLPPKLKKTMIFLESVDLVMKPLQSICPKISSRACVRWIIQDSQNILRPAVMMNVPTAENFSVET